MKTFEEILASRNQNIKTDNMPSHAETSTGKSFEQIVAANSQPRIISQYNSFIENAKNGTYSVNDLINQADNIRTTLNQYSKYYDVNIVSQITSGLDSFKEQVGVENSSKNIFEKANFKNNAGNIPRTIQDEKYADEETKQVLNIQKAETAMKNAKKEYEEAPADPLLTQFVNFISDIPTESMEQIKAKEKYEKAAANYYSLTVGDKEAQLVRIGELESKVKDADEVAELEGLRVSVYGKYDGLDYIAENVKTGAKELYNAIGATGDLIIGTPINAVANLFGYEGKLIDTSEHRRSIIEPAREKANSIAAARGDKYNIGGQVIQNVIQMLPEAALAIATGGTSAVTSLSTKTTGYLATAISALAKNPAFWSSNIRTLGTSYEEALSEGASDEVAVTYAVLNSMLSSIVEVGGVSGQGGIQTLPAVLKDKNKNQIIEWIKSSLEEGGEEILQSVISDLLKTSYGKEIDFDPAKLLTEGGMGVLVGAIVGGGQVSFSAIINAKTNAEYESVGSEARAAFEAQGLNSDEVVDYAKKSMDANIRAIVSQENISDADFGRLYQYVCNDISKTISSPESLMTAVNESKNIISENPSEIVGGVVQSCLVTRLIDAGMSLQGAVNTSTNQINKAIPSVDESVNNGYNNNEISYSEDGGNQNGSANTELLARGEVSATGGSYNSLREQSPNTTIIRGELGTLSSNQGIDDRRLAAGTSAWVSSANRQSTQKVGGGLKENFLRSIRGIALQSTDTIGRTLSLELQKKLKDTVFKTEDGKIISFFHWTPNFFEIFKYGDGAYHFGTLPAAIAIKHRFQKNRQGYIKEVYINSKNPLVVYDDGSFSPSVISQQLVNYGLMSTDSRKELSSLDGFFSDDINSEACQYMIKYIEELGFDSYFYRNKHEDTGAWSVGVFHADQIITVAENGVLKEGVGVTEENSSNTLNAEKGANDYTPTGSVMGMTAITARAQNYVKSVGKKLGINVEFVNMESELKRRGKVLPKGKTLPDGFFDRKTNTVYINYTVQRPVEFLLKHELTHYIEQAGFDYFDFQNAVFRSQTFKDWLKNKGYDSQGAYNEDIVDTYSPFTDMNEEKANREIVANFVGEMLFGGEGNLSENFRNALEPKKRGPIGEIIHRFIEWLKARLPGTHKLYTELEAIEQQWLKVFREVNSAPKENTATKDGEAEAFTIVNLDTGKSYVKASRKIIHGDNVAEWRSQISKFFNRSLKRGPIRIKTLEGDILTITKDTASKARDINITENGITRRLTDKEFFVKLKAESHIDELAELSKKNNRPPEPDTKNHSIAKNGFTYRTVYFQDFDNSYYKITLSVGESNGISTIYNVGKIKADNVPNGNIVSAIGSKADTLSANYSIPIPTDFVNNNNSTNNLQFSYEDSNSSQRNILTRLKNGEITIDEADMLLGDKKVLNPVEIANLPRDTANITPKLSPKTHNNSGNSKSKFYDSLMESKLSGIDLKNEISDNEYISNYKSITNKETLNKAFRLLRNEGKERVLKFDNLKPDEASAVDIAVGVILLREYQNAGDTQSAMNVVEKLRSFGTSTGQTLQIFSILQTLTPETMVAYAGKELDTAYNYLVKVKGNKWIDKNAEKLKLTKEDIDFIRTHTLQAAQLPDGSRQKAILLAEICTRIQDKIPPEVGQSMRALQRISMLLNVKTNVRNILGNTSMVGVYVASDFFGNMLDSKISKKSGVRTTGNFGNPLTKKGREHLGDNLKSFKKGLFESYDDFKRGIHTKQEELDRFEVNRGTGKNFNEYHEGKLAKQLNSIAKALNKIDNFTSFCLEAGDRTFFEMWFTNSLNNQMRLNNVETPTLEMVDIAREEALQRTWQNDSELSKSVSKLKFILNKLHIPGASYGFGDFVLKFVKTPANIARAIYEFSPIGLAFAAKKGSEFNYALKTGKFTPQMQKEYVRSMSNAITGTLIYVLVATAVGLGAMEISGGGDDDKDVSNFEKYVVGIPPYSIRLFGQDVTYDWNQPAGAILATVADFMESKKENPNGNLFDDLYSAFKTGGAVFTKQSFLTSLYELFSSDGPVEAIASAIISEPAVFIPQLSSQLASMLDENRRVTYDPSSDFKTSVNKVLVKIPGLRTLLPEQVNVLGETSKNIQYLNPWEAFAAPGNRYPKSSGFVAEAIYELYKETGDVTVMPHAAPNYITVKGNKIQFDGFQKMDYQRIIGNTSAEILSKMLSSEEFKKLDDSQKVKAVNEVYSYATAIAKCSLDYDYETLSAMEGAKSNGEPILSESFYNRLDAKAKQLLVKEYFLSKEEIRCNGNAEKLAKLFMKKANK